MLEADEQMLVEALIAQAAVEALDEAVRIGSMVTESPEDRARDVRWPLDIAGGSGRVADRPSRLQDISDPRRSVSFHPNGR